MITLTEGINDPSIFKAVFLAGGPGSGKSFIVGRTALTALGMRVVNSDDVFEKALKDAGLDAKNPDDIFSPRGQEIRSVSVKKTKNKEEMYIDGRLGLVIDGTGKNSKKITDHKKELEDLGYETAMIFVNTDLETALERNRKRSRSLPDNEVEKMWKKVQDNISTYKRVFGSNEFFMVDNSEGANFEKDVMDTYKAISRWAKVLPNNNKVKNWIKSQKKQRNIKESSCSPEKLIEVLHYIQKMSSGRRTLEQNANTVLHFYNDSSYTPKRLCNMYRMKYGMEETTTTASVAGAGDDGIVAVDKRYRRDKPPRVLKRFRGHFKDLLDRDSDD